MRIERWNRGARAQINLKHALIHANIAHLVHGAILIGKINLARKEANEPIGISNGNGADFHTTRASVVHAITDSLTHGHRNYIGNTSMYAHSRAQRDQAMGIRGSLISVERNTQAHHVKVSFREAIRSSRIVAVHDARVNACRLHRTHGFNKAFNLNLEVKRLERIGRGKVCKASL